MTQDPLIRRPIGSTAETLPVIGLGTWQTFDVGADPGKRSALGAVLGEFVSGGGSVVDSSPMYGSSEEVLGELAEQRELRERLFVATKVWTRGRDEGLRQMERSRTLLRASRIDLMQVHNLVDVETHARTLAGWKQQGKLRYLGITTSVASQHAEMERLMKTRRFDFIQVNYSLAEREAERRLLPLARELGIAVLVNRPFAEGALFRAVKDRPLPPVARDAGAASWAQFFLKWIVGHAAVTCAIPATTRADHLRDNLSGGRGPLPDQATRNRMLAAFSGG